MSDGYHTFDELYEHRFFLYLALVMRNRDKAWASKLHSDGTMYDGWFIVGMDIGSQADKLSPAPSAVSIVERLGIVTTDPPEWDGHTCC